MRQITTIMGELLRILPRYEFEKLEKQHRSNHYTKYYTGWQQLVTLLFAQIAGHDSLRAIQTSLGVHSTKWYHLGLEDIKRSTLSDAMKNRPYQIYEGTCLGTLIRSLKYYGVVVNQIRLLHRSGFRCKLATATIS
ncbi:MAG: DUF4372 domain-containing protein, partial [Eubacteriaceae bacterium]|nr:DUF4372 domain-containing protein [Eubacteriaceae bacterium]